MYFKIVENCDEPRCKFGEKIVRYIEAGNINSLFNILRKNNSADDESASSNGLKMFMNVERDEFERAKDGLWGLLN